MHLVALAVDVGHNLLFVGDACLFLLDKAVRDAFDLGADRVQSVVVILYAVSFFLLDCSLEFVPEKPRLESQEAEKRFNQNLTCACDSCSRFP